MEDKDIRICILEELKKIFDETPHQYSSLDNLQNELSNP